MNGSLELLGSTAGNRDSEIRLKYLSVVESCHLDEGQSKKERSQVSAVVKLRRYICVNIVARSSSNTTNPKVARSIQAVSAVT